ncbi:MAG: peptide chain release factor N(5)-glutamine methyltransferase [Thalassovita sp.]
MNVTLALRQASAQLKAAGLDAGDARPLLAHALGVPRDRLLLMGGDEVTPAALDQFEQHIAARLARKPVSKIMGGRLFWGHHFEVTQDVLDPRPETECLIAEALTGPAPVRLLDLGTGSGCIGATLLAELPNAQGVLSDLSPAALAVAKRNLAALAVQDRAQLVQSDWFEAISGRYDLIVSNPPYITALEMQELDREVYDHDPHLALTPGGDGLAPYRVIAAQAAAFLSPQGRVMVEMGWRQGPDVQDLFLQAGFRNVAIIKDLDGRDRVVSAAF